MQLYEQISTLTDSKVIELQQKINSYASEYADTTLLARTHGQTASPTTLGKEFANVSERIKKQIHSLKNQRYLGKMNGAVGNFNAHHAAYPALDWNNFSKSFVESLGLEYNEYTTQIEPHDFIAEVFHNFIS